MLVYRVEHPSHGMGPYSMQDGSWEMRELGRQLCEDHGTNVYDYPPPTLDELNPWCNEHFACPSLEALQSWFHGYWGKLFELGYEIVVYETSDYKIGKSGKQLVFNIITAKRK